jgi:hypothetical protein
MTSVVDRSVFNKVLIEVLASVWNFNKNTWHSF